MHCGTVLCWETHPVQVGRDIAIGIENGLVPAELDDLANDHHIPTHVRVQVGTGYTGGRLHCVFGLRSRP